MMVSAPYNFVPLSNRVCTAGSLADDLADAPSQDTPIDGGLSGCLDFELTCEGPLLIGGADDQTHVGDSQDVIRFLHTPGENGRPVIPGSSLRGMLRNVIEIASFSRMGLVDNLRVGVRDLDARLDYGNRLVDGKPAQGYEPRSRAGFLRIDGGQLSLRPCRYARIDHSDLNRMASGFRAAVAAAVNDPKTDNPLAHQVADIYVSKGGKISNVTLWVQDEAQKHEHSVPLRYRRAADTERTAGRIATRGMPDGLAPACPHKGEIVFTGQPGPNKHMEFFFFAREAEAIPVEPQSWTAFIAVHEEQEKTSPTWLRAKSILDAGGEIPVFFLPGTPEKPVMQLGLAMMFKLAADFDIHNMIRHTNPDHVDAGSDDLATRIFGKVAKVVAPEGDEPARTEGYRTRVSFGWAKIVGQPDKDYREQVHKKVVQAKPKPSFTPSYVRQRDFTDPSGTSLLSWEVPKLKGGTRKVKAQYRSYMEWNGQGDEIRGWKRYPAQPETPAGQLPVGTDTTASDLCPIVSTGTEPLRFIGTIRFHNLHEIELGALVWALGWGGNAGLRHALGRGKPFGWGQVKFKFDLTETLATARTAFETAMESWAGANDIPGGWASSVQLRQLKAMADPELGALLKDGMLRQMTLDPHGTNEFKAAKGAQSVLPEYGDPSAGIIEEIKTDEIKKPDTEDIPVGILQNISVINFAIRQSAPAPSMAQFEKGDRVLIRSLNQQGTIVKPAPEDEGKYVVDYYNSAKAERRNDLRQKNQREFEATDLKKVTGPQ